jgi:hypothetical protein
MKENDLILTLLEASVTGYVTSNTALNKLKINYFVAFSNPRGCARPLLPKYVY